MVDLKQRQHWQLGLKIQFENQYLRGKRGVVTTESMSAMAVAAEEVFINFVFSKKKKQNNLPFPPTSKRNK